MKRLLLITLIISLPVGYFISCKKDKGDPPLLPPYASMVIDFSNFTSLKKSMPEVPSTKGTESSTWEFAANLAGIWNTLINTNIQIPLAAYHAAAGNNPTFVSTGLWQWSYNFTFSPNTYKAKLQGQISSGTVTWKLYITNEATGGFTEYLWLEGTSKADGSSGQWKFRQSPTADVQLFQTDWTKSGDQVTAVKYTYTKADVSKDSFINYLEVTSGSFDSGYNIHFSDGTFSDADIEWNISTRDGRLNCVDYLQDNNWYCWDTNKINKVCD